MQKRPVPIGFFELSGTSLTAWSGRPIFHIPARVPSSFKLRSFALALSRTGRAWRKGLTGAKKTGKLKFPSLEDGFDSDQATPVVRRRPRGGPEDPVP